MSIGVPIKVLHEAEGHIVTCETNTGEVYRGKLIEAEDNMNCQVGPLIINEPPLYSMISAVSDLLALCSGRNRYGHRNIVGVLKCINTLNSVCFELSDFE